ncbi:hypothetical protein BU25DRAFT_426163 [Macroventuria anomochaeta]|uniref:Uncharacterized protein n=1 Tax=Macroventuria anomochaeta TaxID=301207 RepID=A0ACB6RLC9_9PLEO|nr:uncharacterized protein BU25DRAFT_426163 [Macroventuria anomochaeta]KAF2621908.1 hypothetical protein BU25DRAFT_426163 [Macroventuria anomochaeta]
MQKRTLPVDRFRNMLPAFTKDPSNLEMLHPFPNNITVAPKPTARKFAHRIFNDGFTPGTLVFWIHSSACNNSLNDPGTAVIRYIDSETRDWQEQVTISHLITPADTESVAVGQALNCAGRLTEYLDQTVVFTDGQRVLHALKKNQFEGKFGGEIVGKVLTIANAFFDGGIQVDLHWSPYPPHVKGYHRVDEVSRMHRRLA